MNLRAIDLNLLVALDALLDEVHVSRAAYRLNLSQPAASNALQRCRDLFGDQLLERGRGTMRRTPRAEALRGQLKSLLAEVHDLIDPPAVALSDLTQIVRITVADDPTAIFAPPLIAALRKIAPGISIIFQPWRGAESAALSLLNGEADIAISVFPRDIEGLQRIKLMEETYGVAMRRGHPAAEQFDLDAWLNWPHIVVSGQGEMQSPLDDQLSAIGQSRKVGVVLPSFQLVFPLLIESDHVAMVPRRSFMRYNHPGLVCFEPPTPVDGFPLHLAYHTRQSNDPGLQYVISEIRKIFVLLG
jgi:DNA-binding transcriptional LysR family regulator